MTRNRTEKRPKATIKGWASPHVKRERRHRPPRGNKTRPDLRKERGGWPAGLPTPFRPRSYWSLSHKGREDYDGQVLVVPYWRASVQPSPLLPPYRTRNVQYALVKNATCTITAAVVHVPQSVLRICKGAYFNCANSESVLANMHIAQSVLGIHKGTYFNCANSLRVLANTHIAQSVPGIRKGTYFNCANMRVLANMHIAQSETSRKGEKQYGSVINHISYSVVEDLLCSNALSLVFYPLLWWRQLSRLTRYPSCLQHTPPINATMALTSTTTMNEGLMDSSAA